MPRLTNTNYLQQRHHLCHLWFAQDGGSVSRLSATEQWDLHGFYGITEQFDEKQILAYRAEVTREQPSLPQRAGRAYAHLQAIEHQLAKLPPRTPVMKDGKRRNHRSKDLNIQVRALVHPVINYEKLASALLEHAQNELRHQADEDSKAA